MQLPDNDKNPDIPKNPIYKLWKRARIGRMSRKRAIQKARSESFLAKVRPEHYDEIFGHFGPLSLEPGLTFLCDLVLTSIKNSNLPPKIHALVNLRCAMLYVTRLEFQKVVNCCREIGTYESERKDEIDLLLDILLFFISNSVGFAFCPDDPLHEEAKEYSIEDLLPCDGTSTEASYGHVLERLDTLGTIFDNSSRERAFVEIAKICTVMAGSVQRDNIEEAFELSRTLISCAPPLTEDQRALHDILNKLMDFVSVNQIGLDFHSTSAKEFSKRGIFPSLLELVHTESSSELEPLCDLDEIISPLQLLASAFEMSGDDSLAAVSKLAIVLFRLLTGDYEQALNDVLLAKQTLERSEVHFLVCVCDLLVASLLRVTKQYDKAVKAFSDLNSAHLPVFIRAVCCLESAGTYYEMGNLEAAALILREGVSDLRHYRQSIFSDHFRIGIYQATQLCHHLLLKLSLELGDFKRAIEHLEQLKAKSLSEIMEIENL